MRFRCLPWTAWSLALVTAVCLLACDSPRIAKPKNVSAQERRDAFEWFDGLGLLDAGSAPFVRVTTGRPGGDGARNEVVHGFLLDGEEDTFRVLLTDLTKQTFVKTAVDAPAEERTGYEAITVNSYAEQWLADLEVEGAGFSRERRLFGAKLSLRAELFVVARACAAQGHDDVASKLCDYANRTDIGSADRQPASFQPAVSADVADGQMWQAVAAFGYPGIPRPRLRERFQRITEHFADSEHAARAQGTASMLEVMIDEDRARAEAGPVGLQEMAVEDRVAELIFQLRDQNGRQWSQPGACDVFSDPRGEESPAHQLVEIGFDSVPQLIAALEDQRFTRSVGFHRDFYFSHHVLRVGDAALAILQEIAGRTFYQRTYTNAAMTKDGAASTVQAEASAWWAEVQEKGEKQVLIEAVGRGDDSSVAQARRLVEKHPDVALEALESGLARAEEPWTRSRLVQIVDELPGDAAAALLSRQLRSGPDLATRLPAAMALYRRGRTADAVDAMIEQWRQYSRSDGEDGRWIDTLIDFLAGCGQVRAVEALAEDLRRRPVDLRVAVVGAYAYSRSFSFFAVGSGPAGLPDPPPKPEDGFDAAVQSLLVAELSDRKRHKSSSMGLGDARFTDPRVCELASYVLSKRWPQRFAFDPGRPCSRVAVGD